MSKSSQTKNTQSGLEAHQANKSNFYVFEALDGVGKTSTAKAFAEEIDAKYLESHSEEFEDFKPHVKDPEHSLETKLLFYLGSNSSRSDYIREELNKGNDVVIDRYYHSTLAFHHAKSGEEVLPYLDLVETLDILEPDTAFYLWVDEDERLNRIENRDEEGHEFELDSEFMRDVDKAYRKIAQETSMPSIEAVDGVSSVVDEALEHY